MVVDRKVLAAAEGAMQNFNASVVQMAAAIDEDTSTELRKLNDPIINKFLNFLDNDKAMSYADFENAVRTCTRKLEELA